MPVTYPAAVKTARMQATADAYDSGTLEIQSGAGVPLAIFALGDQVAAVSNNVWTFNFTSSTTTGETGAGTGTDATQAVIKNAGATANITGLTVGTSGADINLDNVNIADGQSVNITSATITHAPDP